MSSRRVSWLAVGALMVMGAGAAHADGDPKVGEKIFRVCKACHTIEAGGPNRVGPNLHGIIGRPSASAEGFAYSDAMKSANLVWDEETLEGYLQDPKKFMPGNKMTFSGIRKEKDLDNLIAYLKQES